jgi:hypothetical protein
MSNRISQQISRHLTHMRAAATAAATPLYPPLLLLGTSERVGSNWLSDTLRAVSGQHNEPFRQQLAPGHPLSALNPEVTDLPRAAQMLGPYARHWLAEFTTGKYRPVRQVVKETNLFFTWPNLLALFPDAPVAVLTRSPLGVVSSFARGGLWRRWDYQARYQQMAATTRRAEHRRYAPLVPDSAPAWPVALVRLHVLNALLLADALAGRDVPVVPYETALADQQAALQPILAFLPGLDAMPGRRAVGPPTGGDDTFTTTAGRSEPVAFLDGADAELVRSATAHALKTARGMVAPSVAERAACWLGGDHRYLLSAPVPRPVSRPRRSPGQARAVKVAYVPDGAVEWRNLLVSNGEFAAFLNVLADVGLVNDHGGAHLLVCPMPHERGGRLHHDPDSGRWRVSDGYADHPVYWVTWIGAAMFAAAHGGRLPTRSEMIVRCGTGVLGVSNCDYAYGDVTPVHEPGRAAHQIHHLVGNVQVWCWDGPAERFGGPAARWQHGAAWNTPGTEREIHRARYRHITGASRGTGIRIVRDLPAPRPVPAGVLAELAGQWLGALTGPGPLNAHAENLARRLAELLASQPDSGLGPHVGARSREPVPDQGDELVAEPQRGQLGDRDELHTPDRPAVRARGDVAEGAADPAGLKSDVHDVDALAGQVITHVQQPPRLDHQAGLLADLPHERRAERLPMLDLAAGQRPRPAGVGVLVEQQDLIALDDDGGHPNVQHSRTLPKVRAS